SKAPWLVAATAVVVALAAFTQNWLTHRQDTAPDVSKFSITLPPGTRYSSPPASIVAPQLAISPDGRAIAFVAEKLRGRPGVWVRRLDALEARLLPGTDDAIYPFWSPDSKFVGFFARGKLKTIAIDGGPTKDLADAPLDSRGATWNADNVIVYSPNSYG